MSDNSTFKDLLIEVSKLTAKLFELLKYDLKLSEVWIKLLCDLKFSEYVIKISNNELNIGKV